jgi:hypothetical protein
MDAPKGWTNEEWYEFQDYMSGLTCQEQEIQIQSMKALGEAKVSGKNVVIINQYYEM